jgi:hypothetical protein
MDLCRIPAILLALTFAGCASLPVELDEKEGISRVYEKYRAAKSVERASDTFFETPSDDSPDAVFRTDPKSKVGYEFAIALHRSVDVVAGSKFRLEYVAKEGLAPTVREFPITSHPGWFFGEYKLVLTGSDAPSARWYPVAWRISLIGPDGVVLAARRSFLWGAPADTVNDVKQK